MALEIQEQVQINALVAYQKDSHFTPYLFLASVQEENGSVELHHSNMESVLGNDNNSSTLSLGCMA